MNRQFRNPFYVDTDDSVLFAPGAGSVHVLRVLIHNANASVQTVEIRDRAAISGSGATVSGASTYTYALPAGTLAGLNVVNCVVTSNSADALIVAQVGDTIYTREDIGTGGLNFDASWSIAGHLHGTWRVPASVTTEFTVEETWRGAYVEILPANVTMTLHIDTRRSSYDLNKLLGDSYVPRAGQSGSIS